MLSASHVAESLRDSEEPQLRCGVSLGEADLRGGVQREVSYFVDFVTLRGQISCARHLS